MNNQFLKGFFSLFSWFDCYHNLSPSERVDEILDDFYYDHPYIERDDNKALEKDWKSLYKDCNWSNKEKNND